MKWFRSKKWLVFCFCFFLVIGQGSLLWAQPETEEEEEVLQARPNPMDKTSSQFRPNPMEKTTLKDRTGISVKGTAPANWDPSEKTPSMQKGQLVPKVGKVVKGREGVAVKGGAPVSWDPFDKNPARQKNQLVPQAGQSMSIKVQSGVGSGQAAQPGAVMEVVK